MKRPRRSTIYQSTVITLHSLSPHLTMVSSLDYYNYNIISVIQSSF